MADGQDVASGELGGSLRHVGAFVKVPGVSLGVRRRAPRIGEHNAEVLGGELGLSVAELDSLERSGVV